MPFWWGRFLSAARRLRGIVGLYFQLQEVWLRSRPKSRTEEALLRLIAATRKDIVDWRGLTAKEVIGYYRTMKDEIPEIEIPSIPRVWLMKKNPFQDVYTRSYFQGIWRHWYRYVWNPVKWFEVCTFECVNAVRFYADFANTGKIRKGIG